jgi:hypothetical protein
LRHIDDEYLGAWLQRFVSVPGSLSAGNLDAISGKCVVYAPGRATIHLNCVIDVDVGDHAFTDNAMRQCVDQPIAAPAPPVKGAKANTAEYEQEERAKHYENPQLAGQSNQRKHHAQNRADCGKYAPKNELKSACAMGAADKLLG